MPLEKMSKKELLFLVNYMKEKDTAFAVKLTDMLTENISTEEIDRVVDRILARNERIDEAGWQNLEEELAFIFGFILEKQLIEGYTMKVILASVQLYRRISAYFDQYSFPTFSEELFAIIRSGRKELEKWNPALLKHPLIVDELAEELGLFTEADSREKIEKLWVKIP